MFNIRLKNWSNLRADTRPAINATFALLRSHIKSVSQLANGITAPAKITGRTFAYHLLTISLLMFGQTQAGWASGNMPHPFVVSGVIINSNNGNLIERFAQYLSAQSGYPLQVVYVNKYAELSRVLRENPKAVGWTCGAPFVEDNDTTGQQLVAVPLFNKKPTYHSLVLTRSDRREKTLADFKGGVLAYSDPRSNSGFLAPRYALHKQAIDINKHFRLLLNTGSHEGSINALLNNLADVAAVDEYIWVAYQKKHPEAKQKLHEIERMGPFPFTPIVTGIEVNANEIDKLSSALLNMGNKAEGQKLLAEFYLDGFVEKPAAFYQPIKDMLREVNIDSGN